jgi:transcriptional regulator with XRE-family HTH domain
VNSVLLNLRLQHGWTQEELSKRSGISVRTIRDLERGRIQNPRRSSIDLLLSVLDPELRRDLRDQRADDARTSLRLRGGPSPAFAGQAGRWRGPRPPRTGLIGRATDVEQLVKQVTTHPVTVLTGPGGVGKSRLALAAAQAAANVVPTAEGAESELGASAYGTGSGAASASSAFAEGVAVVQLGAVAPESPDTFSAFPQAFKAVRDLLGEEAGRLVNHDALLVLDNTEHIPRAVTLLIEQVRSACPDVRIIVTTRRPPAVPDARIWEVAPLDPAAGAELLHQRLSVGSLAADLAGAGGQVEELCRELGGIPRLIEFAAYRLRSVPISALLCLDQSAGLLGFPDYAVLPQQRSLCSCLQWSWDLLTDRQRRFLRTLADQPETAGGFPGHDPLPNEPISRVEAVALLADLAENSLLQVDRGDRYAYRMLPPVRAFVRHFAPPEGVVVGARHEPLRAVS